jgi:hypothetical protein
MTTITEEDYIFFISYNNEVKIQFGDPFSSHSCGSQCFVLRNSGQPFHYPLLYSPRLIIETKKFPGE